MMEEGRFFVGSCFAERQRISETDCYQRIWDLGDGFAIKAQINWERMAVNGLWERIERMGERIERMGERIERIELLYQILRQLHLFAEVVCQRIGSGLTDLASL